MIKVGLLTIEEKNIIFEQLFDEDSYFNPTQDADNNWIISQEEMIYCTNPEFIWVKNLPLIDYKPVETIIPII
jgi:hypothetical protein